MSACLAAEGQDFDVDRLVKLLAGLNLSPSSIRRRGEENSSGRIREYSFISFGVSPADLADAHQQIHDALDFVHVYDSALQILAEFPGLAYRFMDFGIEERDVLPHVDVFPHELLAALGRFRIDLHVSRYPQTPEDDTSV